jgi:hypothetical protein
MNYLVIPCYTLLEETSEVFHQMRELSIASFKKNLKGVWQSLTLHGTILDDRFETRFSRMHMEMFNRLYKLWEEGHNVLFVDTDTLCLNPTYIFEVFNEMRMFWNTAELKESDTYTPRFKPYLNAGVMYFPATMTQETWDVGLRQMPFIKHWDDSQEIYNEMFRSQFEDNRFPLNPFMNFSPHVESGIAIKQALIVHFHGSKDYSATLKQMEALSGRS